jgi:hypothetical protein
LQHQDQHQHPKINMVQQQLTSGQQEQQQLLNLVQRRRERISILRVAIDQEQLWALQQREATLAQLEVSVTVLEERVHVWDTGLQELLSPARQYLMDTQEGKDLARDLREARVMEHMLFQREQAEALAKLEAADQKLAKRIQLYEDLMVCIEASLESALSRLQDLQQQPDQSWCCVESVCSTWCCRQRGR